MIYAFNLSIMPRGYGRTLYVGSGGDTFGDVVIWLGGLYCSWNWGPGFPGETPAPWRRVHGRR